MVMKPLTDQEMAVVRYIGSANPPATEPVPEFISDALRRIVESANPVDTLRHEFAYVADLIRRHDIDRAGDS